MDYHHSDINLVLSTFFVKIVRDKNYCIIDYHIFCLQFLISTFTKTFVHSSSSQLFFTTFVYNFYSKCFFTTFFCNFFPNFCSHLFHKFCMQFFFDSFCLQLLFITLVKDCCSKLLFTTFAQKFCLKLFLTTFVQNKTKV